MSERDFCIERALQMPEATEAVLLALIEVGAEIYVPIETLTHAERVQIIREIIAASWDGEEQSG